MQPITFNKTPPLDKVAAKLGVITEAHAVAEHLEFLKKLKADGPADAPIPNLPSFAAFIRDSYENTEASLLFPLIDLFRASLSDPRVSGWFAEEKGIPNFLSSQKSANTIYDRPSDHPHAPQQCNRGVGPIPTSSCHCTSHM